jgi:uncharacterized lipoprotein YmbA
MRSRSSVATALLPVVVAALGGLVLAGCMLKRSKDAHIFVLEPLATRGAGEPAVAAPPEAVVGILPVEVPGWVDRPQVTARVAGSQIVADEFARWGEPIARGVQRVVAENLAALLPGRRVVTAPWAGYEPVVHKVDLTLTELARQTDGSVLVEARWAIIGRDRATLAQRRSSHRSPAGVGAAGTVEGSSQALAALSREIAETLQALPLPPPEGATTAAEKK